MNLPSQNSEVGRGIKSGIYAALSATAVFLSGLIAVVHGVPGCGEAVTNYVTQNFLTIVATLGLPTGVGAFIMSFVINHYFNQGVKKVY